MKKSEILYSLSGENFQTVAEETIYRSLTDDEIAKIVTWVEEHTPWFEIIADGILELVGEEDKKPLIDFQEHKTLWV